MTLTDEMVQMREAGASYDAIAAKVGCARSTVVLAFRHGRQAAAKPKPAKAAPVPVTRTIEDFRRDHDQAWKIRDGLKRLFNGGVIMTDAEFREAVSGNPARWRAAADQSEFREHRYRVGGELLWASATTIREMRKIRGEAV